MISGISKWGGGLRWFPYDYDVHREGGSCHDFRSGSSTGGCKMASSCVLLWQYPKSWISYLWHFTRKFVGRSSERFLGTLSINDCVFLLRYCDDGHLTSNPSVLYAITSVDREAFNDIELLSLLLHPSLLHRSESARHGL